MKNVSAYMLIETGGGYGTGIDYTVAVQIDNLKLFRNVDNTMLFTKDNVATGDYKTADHLSYISGGKYHFLINNTTTVEVTVP